MQSGIISDEVIPGLTVLSFNIGFMNYSFSRLKEYLLKNTGAFILILVIFNFAVIKIPFHRLFEYFFADDIAGNIGKILHSIIIVYVTILVIRLFSLQEFAGIKVFRIKNAALLILPFIYPMILGYSNLGGLNVKNLNYAILIVFFITKIAKGIAEEIAFRGLLQSYLLNKIGDRDSVLRIVLVSSIAFALMHIINITRYSIVDVINQVIGAFFFGVFFGALLLRTGNVYALGVIHGCINFVFGIGSINPQGSSSEDKYLNSGSEIVLAILNYTLFFLPLLILGILLLRGITKDKAKTKQKLHDI